MKDEHRTALLLRCTEEEAQVIHAAAKREHRTLSGYILNVVMNRIKNRDLTVQRVQEMLKRNRSDPQE